MKRTAKDGRSPWCKPCTVRNSQQSRQKRPNWKAEKKAYDKARVTRLHDELRPQWRQYYVDNREKLIADSTQWRIDNRELSNAIKQTYKARKRQQGDHGGATTAQVQEWLALQLMNCVWCGIDCAERFELDHVQPLAKGGRHELYNLAVACPSCNRRKSKKLPLQFALDLVRDAKMEGVTTLRQLLQLYPFF